MRKRENQSSQALSIWNPFKWQQNKSEFCFLCTLATLNLAMQCVYDLSLIHCSAFIPFFFWILILNMIFFSLVYSKKANSHNNNKIMKSRWNHKNRMNQLERWIWKEIEKDREGGGGSKSAACIHTRDYENIVKWVNELLAQTKRAKVLWKQHEFNYFEIILTKALKKATTTESIRCRFVSVFAFFFFFFLLIH